MSVSRQQEDLLSIVKDLQRQVRELRRGSLFNAAISNGGLEVRTPDGNVIVRAGEMVVGSSTGYGMEVFRHNGSRQARFFDDAGGNGYWAMFDEAGEIVVSEDTASGTGLARPYIPLSVMDWADVLTPPLTTDSETWTILHRIHGPRQHPRVRLLLITDSDADTAGEVILSASGVQIGPTVFLGFASNQYQILTAELPAGDHMDFLYLDVQARRTEGTGLVKVAVAWVGGVQS